MGLCFGAGRAFLGLAMRAFGFGTLSVSRRVEDAIKHNRCATITIVLLLDGLSERQIRDDIWVVYRSAYSYLFEYASNSQ